MIKMSISIFTVLLAVLFNASTALSAEGSKPLSLDYDVNVKESIISYDGIKYRKVEYNGQYFFLKLLASETDVQSLTLLCSEKDGSLKSENQVTLSTKVTKRSSLFIDGLKQTCKQMESGKTKIEVSPSIRVGFILDDSTDAKFKNKTIFLNPADQSLNFKADW